jgi:hypothetical protein
MASSEDAVNRRYFVYERWGNRWSHPRVLRGFYRFLAGHRAVSAAEPMVMRATRNDCAEGPRVFARVGAYEYFSFWVA